MVERLGLIKLGFPMFFCPVFLSFAAFAAEQSPVVIKKQVENLEYHSDGSYESTVHIEKMAATDAAAHEMAQYSFSYIPRFEQATVLEAFTKKISGEIIHVSRANIYEQSLAIEGQAPIFSDYRQKTIVFPNVEAGDQIVFTIARRFKKTSLFGKFFDAEAFDRRDVYESVIVNITVPNNVFVNTEALMVKQDIRHSGKSSTYSFHYRNLDPAPENSSILSKWNNEPRFIVSTYKDYRDLAAVYGTLSVGKDRVTPKIEALAKKITAGEVNRKTQAILLYNWVSSHIRYVAIYLGNGGLEPHTADSIVRIGYGDCKDHVVILQALLRAMNIESYPALINTDSIYKLPSVPILSEFNHVISYIPEFDIFADSTDGTAPFGILNYSEYGKSVLVVGGAHSGIMALPDNPLSENESILETASIFHPDGSFTGTTRTTAKGPLGTDLRHSAMDIERGGKENVASRVLHKIGNDGNGTFYFVSPKDSFIDPYEISGKFSLDPRPNIIAGKSFSIPTGLRILPLVGNANFWPGTPRSADAATGCFSTHQVEDLRLSIPEGWDFSKVPSDQIIENQYFNFRTSWNRKDREVSVKRELTVRAPSTLCSGNVLKEFIEAAQKIRATYGDGIELQRQSNFDNPH